MPLDIKRMTELGLTPLEIRELACSYTLGACIGELVSIGLKESDIRERIDEAFKALNVDRLGLVKPKDPTNIQ